MRPPCLHYTRPTHSGMPDCIFSIKEKLCEVTGEVFTRLSLKINYVAVGYVHMLHTKELSYTEFVMYGYASY